MSLKSQINVYCDESRHTNKKDPFMVIGGIWCPRDLHAEISRKITLIRKKHALWREFGWKTLSPNRKDFYWELLNLFQSEPALSFRALVVDRTELDHGQYNKGDAELGFYKLYYQMLVHRLKKDFEYFIYLDWQQNKEQGRFVLLRDILRRKLTGKAKIACLEPVNSRSMQIIQLADLLIGAVGYAWNARNESEIKLGFCADLAAKNGLPRLNVGTSQCAEKFNVFHFTGRWNA
ncbi:MAG: DUF3800 domain-containing protein [Deltaproteobacteria bacterium]|nr:DUF3800 domain-containing protein [Deltaproteobacteria bacterium]